MLFVFYGYAAATLPPAKQNGRMETHCLAGHAGFELQNPSASYVFEML
jgi:hypothetical protein